jgi:hypothetical protein
MNFKRRIERLEVQQLYAQAAKIGREYGLSAEDVLAEARAMLALPPEALRQELEEHRAALEAQGYDVEDLARRLGVSQ